MNLFNESLSGNAPAVSILAATTDIAMITDRDGVIQELHVTNAKLAEGLHAQWQGKALAETVTIESRGKISALLRDADEPQPTRWRQVNHPGRGKDQDWAIKYCVIPLQDAERLLCIGQDLGPLARLQQQLLEAQNTTERDYWQIRQAESKFRVLFQTSPDAILITDASSQQIVDLNPSAQQLIGADFETDPIAGMNGADSARRPTTGIPLKQVFHSSCHDQLASLMARAEINGEASAEDLSIGSGTTVSQTQVAMLRQADKALHVVRLRLVKPPPDPRLSKHHLMALEHFNSAADAMVITDRGGQIIAANRSFSDLAQIVNVEQVIGMALSNWLGQAQIDLNLLLANLRKHGRVRRFNTVVTGSHGVDASVEIAATRLFPDGEDEAIYGFVIRDVSLRPNTVAATDVTTNRSVEELTQLVGRVPLKELVRESADIIERLSIEAALKLTGDNRAAAAEMLGLSRQSLYVKLRRYEMVDPKGDNDPA